MCDMENYNVDCVVVLGAHVKYVQVCCLTLLWNFSDVIAVAVAI